MEVDRSGSMRLSVSSKELRHAVQQALRQGGAECLEDEVQFILESLSSMPALTNVWLDEFLERLSSGESPYTVVGRYPLPDSPHWIAVPVGVMPPGRDTSAMITTIRQIIQRERPKIIADVGCGTGVLGLSALIEAPEAHCSFLDIDSRACNATTRNAVRLGVFDRCTVICGDARDSLLDLSVDLAVANLPFVPTREVSSLRARFRDFAPRIAVDGGFDGLAILRDLSSALNAAIRPGGTLILQFGSGQRDSVLANLGPQWVEGRDITLVDANIIVVNNSK